MQEFLNKLTSRKFWLSAAAFLGAFAAGITGVVVGDFDLTGTALVCGALSAGFYAAAEGFVDGNREASNTTSTNTNFNASANNADIVKDAISNK